MNDHATRAGLPPLHADGLGDGELAAIEAALGRGPNDLERALFDAAWSEERSRKSSRMLLGTLPAGGALVGARHGNAGVIRIGDGWTAVLTFGPDTRRPAPGSGTDAASGIGAASGVGAALAGLLAIGARPIAVLGALRVGDPADPRTRAFVKAGVQAISELARSADVPWAGGELRCDPTHAEDPLVNVLAIGLVREAAIVPVPAPKPGDLLILCGGSGGTGGDDAGDAPRPGPAMAGGRERADGQAGNARDRSSDAGLVDATLEVVGLGLATGLTALGAGGINGGVAEAAGDAGTGIRVDLDAIAGRQPGAASEARLLYSSSARMLLTARPEGLSEIVTICARSGVGCTVIGRVTGDGDIAVVEGGLDATGEPNPGAREIARAPVRAMAPEAVVAERLAAPPPRRRMAPAPGLPEPAGEDLPERGMDPGAVLLGLLGSPNLASRAGVGAPDDRPAQGRTVVHGDHGPTVLRITGTRRALVVAMGGNAAVSATDPYLGAALSVAETARSVSATGARPLAVTHCLAFGDPTRPEAFWQLGEAVRGVGDACRALALPVAGGSVSLAVDGPAPAAARPEVAVLGRTDDAASLVEAAFDEAGDVVLLAGGTGPGLAGSAYAGLAGLAADDEPPALDLAAERAVQAFIRDAIGARLVTAARGVAGGGLAVALGEMAIRGAVGGRFRVAVASEPAVALFGESASRIVLTVRPENVAAVHSLADRQGVPLAELGTVGGARLLVELVGEGATGAAEGRGAGIADALEVMLVDLRHAWEQGLPRALGVEA
jgi:phosphoribosylformylglycinamidine synthase